MSVYAQMPAKATIGPLKGRTTVKTHKRGKAVVHTHTRAVKSATGGLKPHKPAFGQAVHRQYLNPKQIKEGQENGHVIHSSGHVFYHDPEKNDFYIHPHTTGDHVNTVRSRNGTHRAYLKENSKTAINNILKS